jgi:hypothetical protein
MSAQLDHTVIDRFSAYLFWDVDRAQLQVERSRVYIVERVFSHGMLTDWFLLKEIYGKEAIKETVLNLRHLDKSLLRFSRLSES